MWQILKYLALSLGLVAAGVLIWAIILWARFGGSFEDKLIPTGNSLDSPCTAVLRANVTLSGLIRG